MVKTSLLNAAGAGLMPGWGAKVPHASLPKKLKHKNQKQYCNKFNQDFKKKREELSLKIIFKKAHSCSIPLHP